MSFAGDIFKIFRNRRSVGGGSQILPIVNSEPPTPLTDSLPVIVPGLIPGYIMPLPGYIGPIVCLTTAEYIDVLLLNEGGDSMGGLEVETINIHGCNAET